ncbi:MAG: dethiobiotin synthase [Pseudanabaenaceae cyanobacterium SKYGB_i_bin29]|nr:dethiobiotin synthase [Pseudanabaenaceae cyanobacterium SKYG29]MDW8421096.1 dethiobiotin synthase [Pseudanabaenaceae cyanobacterium SKYGB_i_bin29]
MPSLLITGSDTSVGKTIVTTLLASYLLDRYPQQVALYKPVQSGRGDWEYYAEQIAKHQPREEICAQKFALPLAIPLAAEREGKQVDWQLLWQGYQRLVQKYQIVLVEGAGGIGSPVTWEWTVADMAREWQLPTVIVVPVKLGSMTQSIAACALAREAKVDVRGIIFNCVQPYTEEEIYDFVAPDRLPLLTRVPILGFVPALETRPTPGELKQIVANLDLGTMGLEEI